MSKTIMSNVKEKLSSSRTACPGLSEEVYALADFMAANANDKLAPTGMAVCLSLCLADIQREENGFSVTDSKDIPEYLVKHKAQVLAQAVYVPQIIDAIADADFAKEFREICKEVLHFDPPKRDEKYNQNADIEGNYPPYVTVAVNWWANAIVNPKFDNGDDSTSAGMAFLMAMMVNSKNSITKEQIAIFKKVLADEIVSTIESSSWNRQCNLSVDYHPDMLLLTAGQKAGIDDYMSFPWKTIMSISAEKVSVSAGYGANWETLWQA